MKLADLVKPSVLSQPTYEPGKPIETVARELGLDPAAIIKVASNENPFGPSPRAVAAAQVALLQGQIYPDGGCFLLRQKLAEKHSLAPENFIVGNGSNEIIELLGHVFLGSGDEVVMGGPSFIVYKLVTLLFGAKVLEVPLRDFRHDLAAIAGAITPRTKLVVIGSPNNPTGTANAATEIADFLAAVPGHVITVVDEAYAEYAPDAPDLRPYFRAGRGVISLRTFSKAYGLAALRVGYGVAAADLIACLQRVRQPFNVNAVAQAAATAALDDTEFVAHCVRENRAGLARLERGLAELRLRTVPSVANFLLVHVGDGPGVFAALQRRGVIVRPLQPYGLPEWIRLTVGTPEQNERVLAELGAVVAGLPAVAGAPAPGGR